MPESAYLEPSIRRGKECRETMDAALAASVRQILGLPTPGEGGAAPGAVHILDYGAYFDLTLKLPDGSAVAPADQADARQWLEPRFGEAASFDDVTAMRPTIANLSSAGFTAPQTDRMRRWWDMERETAICLAGVDAEIERKAGEALAKAFDRLEAAHPELYGETCALVNQIVLARPEAVDFGGVTSFGLWGGFTLNAQSFNHWTTCFGKTVHEAGHNLLFAYARETPLITDDPESRAYSHIRDEMRPYDGIFHAAFVSAREALAYDALLLRNDHLAILDDDETAYFNAALGASTNNFWGCAETIREQAHVTELGDRILTECEDYMRENFSFADA